MSDEKLLNKLKAYDEKYGQVEREFERGKILANELNLANSIIHSNNETNEKKGVLPKVMAYITPSTPAVLSTGDYHRDNASQIIDGDTLDVKIRAKTSLAEYTNYVLKELGKMNEHEFDQNYKVAIEKHKPLENVNFIRLYAEEIVGVLEGKKPGANNQAIDISKETEVIPSKQQFIENIVSRAQEIGIKVNPVEGKEVSITRITMKNIENILSNLTERAVSIFKRQSEDKMSFREQLSRSK